MAPLLVLVLVFNSLAPLLAMPESGPSSDVVGIEELFSDRILICTASGFRYISIEDYEKGEFPDNHNPQIHCPLCIISLYKLDNFIPDVTAVKLSYSVSGQSYYRDVTQGYTCTHRICNTNPRAPPSIPLT